MSGTLVNLAQQYPTLPHAVLLKTALLSLGVCFGPLLVEAAKTALPDFRPHALPDGTSVQIPYLMILEGGSLVRLRCREDSPFTLVTDGDAFRLLDEGEPVVRFTFADRPAWHGQTAADGTPLDACGLNQHGDMMVLNLTPACEYWSTPRENFGLTGNSPGGSYRCAFCGYGLPDERSRALGQEQGRPEVPPAVLQRAAEAVSKGKASGARHLYLTGGSMTDPELEAERYLKVVRAVREASKGVYLAVGSQALPPGRLPEFKKAGADGVCFNLEIWDREVWQRVCPGKAGFFGREMWEESLVEAVRIFGEGNVYSAFVIGTEMVLDDALTDPEAALKSNIEGVRWLLARGINPILSLFWPFVGTDMEGAAGPGLHFLLRLFAAVNEVRLNLNKPFPGNLACKRCLYMQVEGDFAWDFHR
jgi:hypothetical protein